MGWLVPRPCGEIDVEEEVVSAALQVQEHGSASEQSKLERFPKVSGSGINNNACTFISPLMSLAQVPLLTSDSDSDEAFLVRLAPRQATCTRTRPAIKNWMVQHRPSKRTCVGVCGVGLGPGIQGFGRSGVQGFSALVTPTCSGFADNDTPHDAAMIRVSVLAIRNAVVNDRAPSLW